MWDGEWKAFLGNVFSSVAQLNWILWLISIDNLSISNLSDKNFACFGGNKEIKGYNINGSLASQHILMLWKIYKDEK